jgi:hypothetical protein
MTETECEYLMKVGEYIELVLRKHLEPLLLLTPEERARRLTEDIVAKEEMEKTLYLADEEAEVED